MSEQNGGLTLEELVRRLGALERENAELRGEVATLLCTNVVEEEFCEVRSPHDRSSRWAPPYSASPEVGVSSVSTCA